MSEKLPVTCTTISVEDTRGRKEVVTFPGAALAGLPHREVEQRLKRLGFAAHTQLKLVQATAERSTRLVPRWLFVRKETGDTAEKVRSLLEGWREQGLPDDEGQAA